VVTTPEFTPLPAPCSLNQAAVVCQFLYLGPLQALAAGFVLWYEVGPAALCGLAVFMLMVPLQLFLGRVSLEANLFPFYTLHLLLLLFLPDLQSTSITSSQEYRSTCEDCS